MSLKMNNLIYVNGCSYSTVSDGKRYSEFLGETFNSDVINNALGGSCNARIFRTSIRDLMTLKTQYNLKAVISLTFLTRTEVWDRMHTQSKFRDMNDGEFVSIQAGAAKTVLSKDKYDDSMYKDYMVEHLQWFDYTAQTINILKDIVLFTTWCKHNDIPYLIFSGPPLRHVNFKDKSIVPFYDSIIKDNRVLDIFNECFTESCLKKFTTIDDFKQEINGVEYDVGHHGEQAHKYWADYLASKL